MFCPTNMEGFSSNAQWVQHLDSYSSLNTESRFNGTEIHRPGLTAESFQTTTFYFNSHRSHGWVGLCVLRKTSSGSVWTQSSGVCFFGGVGSDVSQDQSQWTSVLWGLLAWTCVQGKKQSGRMERRRLRPAETDPGSEVRWGWSQSSRLRSASRASTSAMGALQ